MDTKISRRHFLTFAGGTAMAAVFPQFVFGASKAPRKPNLVFILVDDLGWSDLGCYGNGLHETPNIDSLAQQGVRFTEAYAAAPSGLA